MDIVDFHEMFIKDTFYKKSVILCDFVQNVDFGEILNTFKIHSRTLKHIYDKRPAEEYQFFLKNVECIVSTPDSLYKNKIGNRGDFIFARTFSSIVHIVVLEFTDIVGQMEIVTFFRVYKKTYLNSCELLWRRKDGEPSSYIPSI